MAVEINFNANLADIQKEMKILEKEAKKSGKFVTKELHDLNEELEKTIKKQTQFDKREAQMQAALKKQLSNQKLNEEQKQRLIDKYNKAAQRRYKAHYEKVEDLTRKAYKAQEKIQKDSVERQNKLTSSLKSIGGDIGGQLQGMAGGLGGIAGQLGPIGVAAGVAAGAIAGIGAATKEVADRFNQFDLSVNSLAVAMGIGKDEAMGLANELREIQRPASISAEQVNYLASNVANFVKSKDEIPKVTSQLMKLMQAYPDANPEEITQGFSRLTTQLGDSQKAFDILTAQAQYMGSRSLDPLGEAATELGTVFTKASKGIDDSSVAMERAQRLFNAFLGVGNEVGESTSTSEIIFEDLSRALDDTSAIEKMTKALEGTGLQLKDVGLEAGNIDPAKLLSFLQNGSEGADKLHVAMGGLDYDLQILGASLEKQGKSIDDFALNVEGAGKSLDNLLTPMQIAQDQLAQNWDNLILNIGSSTTTLMSNITALGADVIGGIASWFEPASVTFDKAITKANEYQETIVELNYLMENPSTNTQAQLELIIKRMDEIEAISPTAAEMINEVMDNTTMTTEQKLAQINELLKGTITLAEGLRDVEAFEAMGASGDKFFETMYSNITQYENIAGGTFLYGKGTARAADTLAKSFQWLSDNVPKSKAEVEALRQELKAMLDEGKGGTQEAANLMNQLTAANAEALESGKRWKGMLSGIKTMGEDLYNGILIANDGRAESITQEDLYQQIIMKTAETSSALAQSEDYQNEARKIASDLVEQQLELTQETRAAKEAELEIELQATMTKSDYINRLKQQIADESVIVGITSQQTIEEVRQKEEKLAQLQADQELLQSQLDQLKTTGEIAASEGLSTKEKEKQIDLFKDQIEIEKQALEAKLQAAQTDIEATNQLGQNMENTANMAIEFANALGLSEEPIDKVSFQTQEIENGLKQQIAEYDQILNSLSQQEAKQINIKQTLSEIADAEEKIKLQQSAGELTSLEADQQLLQLYQKEMQALQATNAEENEILKTKGKILSQQEAINKAEVEALGKTFDEQSKDIDMRVKQQESLEKYAKDVAKALDDYNKAVENARDNFDKLAQQENEAANQRMDQIHQMTTKDTIQVYQEQQERKKVQKQLIKDLEEFSENLKDKIASFEGAEIDNAISLFNDMLTPLERLTQGLGDLADRQNDEINSIKEQLIEKEKQLSSLRQNENEAVSNQEGVTKQIKQLEMDLAMFNNQIRDARLSVGEQQVAQRGVAREATINIAGKFYSQAQLERLQDMLLSQRSQVETTEELTENNKKLLIVRDALRRVEKENTRRVEEANQAYENQQNQVAKANAERQADANAAAKQAELNFQSAQNELNRLMSIQEQYNSTITDSRDEQSLLRRQIWELRTAMSELGSSQEIIDANNANQLKIIYDQQEKIKDIKYEIATTTDQVELNALNRQLDLEQSIYGQILDQYGIEESTIDAQTEEIANRIENNQLQEKALRLADRISTNTGLMNEDYKELNNILITNQAEMAYQDQLQKELGDDIEQNNETYQLINRSLANQLILLDKAISMKKEELETLKDQPDEYDRVNQEIQDYEESQRDINKAIDDNNQLLKDMPSMEEALDTGNLLNALKEMQSALESLDEFDFEEGLEGIFSSIQRLQESIENLADKTGEELAAAQAEVFANAVAFGASITEVIGSIPDIAGEISDAMSRGAAGEVIQDVSKLTQQMGGALLGSGIPPLMLAGSILLLGGTIGNLIGKAVDAIVGQEKSAQQIADERAAAEEYITAEYENQIKEMELLLELGDRSVDTAKERLDILRQEHELLADQNEEHNKYTEMTDKQLANQKSSLETQINEAELTESTAEGYQNWSKAARTEWLRAHSVGVNYFTNTKTAMAEYLADLKASATDAQTSLEMVETEVDYRKEEANIIEQVNSELQSSLDLSAKIQQMQTDTDVLKNLQAQEKAFRNQSASLVEMFGELGMKTDFSGYESMFDYIMQLSDTTLENMDEDTRQALSTWLDDWQEFGKDIVSKAQTTINLKVEAGVITEREGLDQELKLWNDEITRLNREQKQGTDYYYEVLGKVKNIKEEITSLDEEDAKIKEEELNILKEQKQEELELLKQQKQGAWELVKTMALRTNNYKKATKASYELLVMQRKELSKTLGLGNVSNEKLFDYISNLGVSTLTKLDTETQSLIQSWLTDWSAFNDDVLADEEQLISLRKQAGEITEEKANEDLLDLYNKELARLVKMDATEEEILEIKIKILDINEAITDEMNDQDGIDTSRIESLSKQLQLIAKMARETGNIKSPKVQAQLASIQSDIVAEMQTQGFDQETINQTIQNIQDMRQYATGGWIDRTGPAVVDKGEFVLKEDVAKNLNQVVNLDALNLTTSMDEINRLMTKVDNPAQRVIAQTFDYFPANNNTSSNTFITVELGENQFVISGVDNANIEKKLAKWEAGFNDRVVTAIQKKGLQGR